MGSTETEYEPLFTKTDNKLSTTVKIDRINVDFYVPPLLIEKNSSRTFLDKGGVLQTDEAKQVLSEMLDLTPDTVIALLAVMRRYKIRRSAYITILKEVDISFSNVKFDKVAPLFGLQRGQDPTFLSFEIKRSRLPLQFIKKICQDVANLVTQYGNVYDYHSVESMSRFIPLMMGKIFYLFGGHLRNVPEKRSEGQFAAGGRIDHIYEVSGCQVAFMVRTDKDLSQSPAAKKDLIAQILSKSDAIDYHNFTSSLWAPIIAILSDKHSFQFYVYHSDTRKIYSSSVQTGLEGIVDWESKYVMEFYHCIKRVVEQLFDLLMFAYINGLKAHHNQQLNCQNTLYSSNQGIRSAHEALAYFRYASDVACDTSRLQEAENISLYSLEKLRHSTIFSSLPYSNPYNMNVWSDNFMGATNRPKTIRNDEDYL